MQQMTIEYVLDSPRPGYTVTSASSSLSKDTLDAVWREAMPRGQGWRRYVGARSLKCFPLEGGRLAAISEVTVTNQADESGRRGIRRAKVMLINGEDYLPFLQERLDANPYDDAQARLTLGDWTRIIDRALPKIRKRNGQVILAAPYTTPEGWQYVEALVLRVALSPALRTVKGFPRVLPLTTLALDPREESRLVAVAAQETARLDGYPVIELTPPA